MEVNAALTLAKPGLPKTLHGGGNSSRNLAKVSLEYICGGKE